MTSCFKDLKCCLSSLFFFFFLPITAPGQKADYLPSAHKAEKWLLSLRKEDSNGYYWPNIKDSSSSTIQLYSGSSGIVLFYLAMYKATGDRKFLFTAEKALKHILSQLPKKWNEGNVGLYSGGCGIFYTLHQAYLVTENKTYLQKANQLLRSLTVYNTSDSANKSMLNDIVYGYAGVGLTFLYAYKNGIDPNGIRNAEIIGTILLGRSVKASKGIRWPMLVQDTARKFYMPNFSHGTAGVAYFLACLYEITRKPEFLDAALQAANHLKSIADTNGWIYHAEPNATAMNRYYLSWCHGPAGTARLYYKLYQVTGNKSWEDQLLTASSALMKCGIPENKTTGYWNNVSFCCGNAGIAEFFLSLSQVYKRKEFRDFADHMLNDLVEKGSSKDGMLWWVQAEHRAQPELLQAQTGLMQGAAGMGLTLLHAIFLPGMKNRWPTLPDNPF